ncbi:MAG: sulfite exporter TauE/SafE family protein [Candidatus Thermoplasmatota archaeon]
MVAPLWAIAPFILVGALLYSSVGHGGATVYLAILTLAGFAVAPLATTVQVLNVIAASIAFLHFRFAGHLRPKLLLSFIITSVPAAYAGGRYPFSDRAAGILLAVVLLVAAARFLFFARPPSIHVPQTVAWRYVGAPILGAVLGFAAGATGIGGGIFLSPILLMIGWCTMQEAGAIASAFIVLNSLAGLAAKLPSTPLDGRVLAVLGAAVLVGALIGAYVGARKLPARSLQVLLGCVLVVAGVKALI